MARRKEGATQADRIMALFRASKAELPPPNAGILAELLQPGQLNPVEELAEMALSRLAAEPVRQEWTPAAVARELGLPPPSVRREMQKLRDQGRIESTGEGSYTAPEDEEGLTPEQAEEWVIASAEQAGKQTVRIFEHGGMLVACPAEYHGTRRDRGGAPRNLGVGKDHKQGIPVEPPPGKPPEDTGRRKLQPSWDKHRKKIIPVFSTPMSRLEVIDVDHDLEEWPEDVIGVGVSRSGKPRLYARPPAPGQPMPERPGIQDPNYLRMSRGRGRWQERLFDDDGGRLPAPKPRPGASKKDRGLMEYIGRLWTRAQEAAERLNLQKGVDEWPKKKK